MYTYQDFKNQKQGLEQLIDRGDKALDTPWPTLTATDYLDFKRNGRRVYFEKKYFDRRHLLNDLVLAECAAQSGKYIDAIINGVWALCEESGWQLPPHNSYNRGGPNLPLPDPQRPVVELFSCETAASLSLIFHLLGDQMEAAAPGITTRLMWEIEHRVIEPYLINHFWWMGNGDEPMCNWTPWCTQNMLLVALLTKQDEITVQSICNQAEKSLHSFLKDYGEDGCCDEGAKYYGHAGLCLFAAIETLTTLAGSHYKSWYTQTKIRNIADFIRQMHVGGDYYINFADCPPKLEPPGALVYLFGKRTNNPGLMAFGAQGMRERGFYTPSQDLSLYTRVMELFTAEEASNFNLPLQQCEDIYFESAGVLIARDHGLCLAVKAGDNNDNHNHNDVGSVTLYSDGKPFLIDVGVGSYTSDTFSSRRYTIWTMQSGYHNTPTFDDVMQNPGASYKANDVTHTITDEKTTISMDIASAYPTNAGVDSYVRTVTMQKNHKPNIVINDQYNGTATANLTLMFACSVEVENGNKITAPGLGQIYVTGSKKIEVECIDVTDPLLQKVWGNKLYRALITVDKELTLEIEAL